MHEKFLYLWNQGIRPELVIVGYSHNEGLLPEEVLRGGEDLKGSFERRVKLKNFLRSYALNNLLS